MSINNLNKLVKERGGKDKVFLLSESKPFQDKYRKGILFYEQHALNNDIDIETIYSLDDKEGYISLKDLYLEIADPTEYRFANTCFFNYEHFCKLMEHAYFKKFINRCRDELELKLRSDAVNNIKEEALTGKGATMITAAKYVIERGWIGNKKDREVLKRRISQDKEINETISKDLELLKPIINGR